MICIVSIGLPNVLSGVIFLVYTTFTAFALKAKRFVFAGFLHLLLYDFSGISGNLEQNTILQTIKQLIQFSSVIIEIFLAFSFPK